MMVYPPVVPRPSTLLDFSEWAVVRVSGPDAREFLQGAGTKDVNHIDPQRSLPSLFLTPKGRPIALAWIAAWDETLAGGLESGVSGSQAGAGSFVLMVEPGGALVLPEHLDGIRVMEDIDIRPLGGPGSLGGGVSLIGVAGVAHEERAAALAAPVPGAWAVRGAPMSFVLLAPEAMGGSAADLGPLATDEALEAWRIAAGIPRAGMDFNEERIATELALEEAISLTKGCYVGQEVVARTVHRGAVRRRRIGFRYAGAAGRLPPGTELRAGGEAAGFITSTTIEPGTGRGLGMGYLRMEALVNPVEVLAIQGTVTTHLEVAPWPL